MSDSKSLSPDAVIPGSLSGAPFVLPPDAARLFARRAQRLRQCADAGPLAPYLSFLAAIAQAQADIEPHLPPPRAVSTQRAAEAAAHAMPLLTLDDLTSDPAFDATLDRLFDAVASAPMPAAAASALDKARRNAPEVFAQAAGMLFSEPATGAVPPDGLFVAAGLQLHAARAASSLAAATMRPIATGVCPACGGRPAVSLVVGVAGAEGARYAVCSLCATQWNEVRVTCLSCGSNAGIRYRAVETAADEADVKAETCEACHGWLKIVYQNRNPALDPFADDVASLGLDLKMRETEFQRRGVNPWLAGY